MKTLLTAMQYATRKHNGQTRKNKDGPPFRTSSTLDRRKKQIESVPTPPPQQHPPAVLDRRTAHLYAPLPQSLFDPEAYQNSATARREQTIEEHATPVVDPQEPLRRRLTKKGKRTRKDLIMERAKEKRKQHENTEETSE